MGKILYNETDSSFQPKSQLKMHGEKDGITVRLWEHG